MGAEISLLCTCNDDSKSDNIQQMEKVSSVLIKDFSNTQGKNGYSSGMFQSKGSTIAPLSPERTLSEFVVKSKEHPEYALEPHYELIEYSNGDTYEGETLSKSKHGKGKITYSDGSVYDGAFKNDKYNGHGRLVTDMIYEGQFEEGKKSGVGICYNKERTYRYEGEWLEDLKHGQGREFYPDKSYYEGTFYKGKKNGRGKLHISNGSEYVGEFKDDKMEGHVMN